jgi:hypothetical protein
MFFNIVNLKKFISTDATVIDIVNNLREFNKQLKYFVKIEEFQILTSSHLTKIFTILSI